jgi:hypothetical protein
MCFVVAAATVISARHSVLGVWRMRVAALAASHDQHGSKRNHDSNVHMAH